MVHHYVISSIPCNKIHAYSYITKYAGDPPSFPTPTEPQDQFVRSDAGNLTLLCPVLNVHPSNITWSALYPTHSICAFLLLQHTYYLCLLRYRGGVVDNQFRQEDGSYFVTINPSDNTYASTDGVEYYCTATNDFGTIRSRNATASIAREYWLVLMCPLLMCMYIIFVDFAEFETCPATEEIDVIVSITNMRQWVSLECAINPGSFPKPNIEWVRHTAGDPEDEEVVEEDEPNTVRFVDDGRYLILETTSEAITDKAYYCRVTNSEFEAGRAPTTYTFNTG